MPASALIIWHLDDVGMIGRELSEAPFPADLGCNQRLAQRRQTDLYGGKRSGRQRAVFAPICDARHIQDRGGEKKAPAAVTESSTSEVQKAHYYVDTSPMAGDVYLDRRRQGITKEANDADRRQDRDH
jgi:hypothetical protein